MGDARVSVEEDLIEKYNINGGFNYLEQELIDISNINFMRL